MTPDTRRRVCEALDCHGHDVPGPPNRPHTDLCDRMVKTVAALIEEERAQRMEFGVLADTASDIAWGGEQGWMEPGYLAGLPAALRAAFLRKRDEIQALRERVKVVEDAARAVIERSSGCPGSDPPVMEVPPNTIVALASALAGSAEKGERKRCACGQDDYDSTRHTACYNCRQKAEAEKGEASE